VLKLDITKSQDAEAAVAAGVDRFDGIDVLVNNAANFYAGYFEELTPEQIERQLATSLQAAAGAEPDHVRIEAVRHAGEVAGGAQLEERPHDRHRLRRH
jgi:NAD(P)-dependent dehydrogenase (short-subunit alcohol dehydrogenase family)